MAAEPDAALGEAMSEVLPEWGVECLPLDEPGSFQPELLQKSRVLFMDHTPSNALLAAYLTMRGVPVMTRDGPLPRALLGPGGYLTPRGDGDKEDWKKEDWKKEDWKTALNEALSEKGRSASASARRFLKENYAASGAAESLMELYRSTSAASFALGAEKRNS
jgi:glycosyltransferase involved in cell wall biosynthesis